MLDLNLSTHPSISQRDNDPEICKMKSEVNDFWLSNLFYKCIILKTEQEVVRRI
jgi:hypothetical protein